MGTGSDWIGNADKAPVSIDVEEVMGIVTATTLKGHMLEGKRAWYFNIKRIDKCTVEVTVKTVASERTVGRGNNYGARVIGTPAQLRVWDEYLKNIADGRGGEIIVGPTHESIDTGSTDMPPFPQF